MSKRLVGNMPLLYSSNESVAQALLFVENLNASTPLEGIASKLLLVCTVYCITYEAQCTVLHMFEVELGFAF